MKPIKSITHESNHEESVRRFVESTAKVLRNISFGDGSNRSEEQNTDTAFLDGVSNGVANTETVFNHLLGRIPVGFIVVNKDKAGDFYKGATAWTATTISLKCNVASVTFKMILH